MINYNKDGIVVRKTNVFDLEYLANNMRQADVQEIWSSHHVDPLNALAISFKRSAFCYTVERKQRPVAIFGVYPLSILGTQASVWMLATDELTLIKRRFVRHSRNIIEHMLSFYPFLYNYVDVRNSESIKWLKWCGARMKEPAPYGAEGMMFHYFYFRRN